MNRAYPGPGQDFAAAIRSLEPEDIGATAALLAKAMDDDPAYDFLFPRGQDRRAGLEDFFARNLRTHLPYRCTYVGVVGSTGFEVDHVRDVSLMGEAPYPVWSMRRRSRP